MLESVKHLLRRGSTTERHQHVSHTSSAPVDGNPPAVLPSRVLTPTEREAIATRYADNAETTKALGESRATYGSPIEVTPEHGLPTRTEPGG